MPDIRIRREMPDVALTREQFFERIRAHFYDPAFGSLAADVDRVVEVAWQAYDGGRKAPRTQKAGPGYADPDYDLSVEWSEASRRIKEAERRQKDTASPCRILLINGCDRKCRLVFSAPPGGAGVFPCRPRRCGRRRQCHERIAGLARRHGPDRGRPSIPGRALHRLYGVLRRKPRSARQGSIGTDETANAARALVHAVKMVRCGEMKQPDPDLREPRPK